VSAIRNSKVFILVLSASANKSKWVYDELGWVHQTDIPIIPLYIGQVEPADDIAILLTNIVPENAFPGPLRNHLEKIARRVLKLLRRDELIPGPRISWWNIIKTKLARLFVPIRRRLIPALALLLLLLVAGVLWWYPSSRPMPDFTRKTGDVEGILLSDLASFRPPNTQLHITGGNFSLICQDTVSRIDPAVLRKFVTALWSIYFSDDAPDVFVEPIPGNKFLVHYNGNIINNDLGRVMREADLLLKNWATGIEKPNIPWFDAGGVAKIGALKDPQEASRRFWLSPENMRYTRSSDVLLFAGGNLLIRPGHGFQSQRDAVSPEAEALAQNLTKFLPQLVQKYPVFQELCDYAKMVGLARYLKESGVPLFGFLMANKDLVLSEDSPEMVGNLSEGLKKFRDVRLAGGINLAFPLQFEDNPQMLKVVSAALDTHRARDQDPGRRLVGFLSTPFPCTIGKKRYTVVPIPAVLPSKSPARVTFATDLALKRGKQPGLELVRYYNAARADYGEFGLSQYLYLPYRLKPEGESKTELLNIMVPERMALVNLISGGKEILNFATEPRVGYFPPKNSESRFMSLFIRTNGTYHLLDKLGIDYLFDEGGLLTDLYFPGNYHVHVDYLERFTDRVNAVPYRLSPQGQEKVKYLNALIPHKMRMIDQRQGETAVLTFRDQGENAAYFPEDERASKFRKLTLRPDASFRLTDKQGNDFVFDPRGHFRAMLPGNDPPLVRNLSSGAQKLSFVYTFENPGKVFVSKVFLQEDAQGTEPVCVLTYEYDGDGKLGRVIGPEASKGH
jgi:hypothetical protein